MRNHKFDVAVIGAGIAGIATCHALLKAGAGSVALIESAAPLSLTSDKSTECYRNFWPDHPDACMANLVNHSIDRLEEFSLNTDNRFQMHQRGYLFATGSQPQIESMHARAKLNERYGGGPLRVHHSFGSVQNNYAQSPIVGIDQSLDGADLITDQQAIRQHFPYLTKDTAGVLHIRRCGVLSAQQLGMFLLEEARDIGAELITGEFVGMQTFGGELSAIDVLTADGTIELAVDALVLASGPHLKATASLAGSDLPVVVERHVKITLPDALTVIPRETPLIIWNDPIDLCWTNEEREILEASDETRYLTETFPAGVHGRPVGAGNTIFIYWTYDSEVMQMPSFPIEADHVYPEILLRGMARMVPGLSEYFDPMPQPYVDGGYYTKVADNRPLIGPLDVPGTFVSGAFSGYGIMASYAGAELVTAHMLGLKLPDYAAAFSATRFKDADYMAKLAGLSASGQI